MAGTNSFNIGRDGAQLTIVSSLYGQITINGVTGFQAKPATVKLKSVDINGRIKHRTIPDGHELTFKIDRQDPTYEQYFAAVEANFFAGLPPESIFVTQTIQNLDGSVSQYQYSDVALSADDDGNWEGQGKVAQSFTAQAGRKIQLA